MRFGFIDDPQGRWLVAVPDLTQLPPDGLLNQAPYSTTPLCATLEALLTKQLERFLRHRDPTDKKGLTVLLNSPNREKVIVLSLK